MSDDQARPARKKRRRKPPAKKKTQPAAATGGRGSPEAIEKRRVARALNTLFKTAATSDLQLDGRTEKRRQRLVAELVEGKSRKGEAPLTAIDKLDRMNQLLEIGETVASLRQQGVSFPRKPVPELRGQMHLVEQTQEAYGFRSDAWAVLGFKGVGD